MVVELKKRADPTKKERLVASKKAWNEIVKLLIAKLIAFKRSINGEGDPDAMLPEIDLKDPFPVEFHTYLASIVDDYDKVIKGADFIMDLQDDFSVTRRKGKRETQEQLSSDDGQLTAEASWWGSRAWAWFDLYHLGKDVRRVRIRMLDWVRKAIHALNTVEYHFNTKTSGSDVQAIVGLTRFINLFIGGYLSRLEQLRQIDLQGLKQLEEAPKAGEEGEPPPPKEEPGKEDVGGTIISGPPPSGPDLNTIKAQLEGGILENRVKRIEGGQHDPNIKAVVRSQLNRLTKAVEDGLSDSDVQDIYDNLVSHLEKAESGAKSAMTEDEEYRKIAQNVLQRWFARKRMELGSKSKSDDIKMQIADEIRDAVRELKELMDIIENKDRSTADISDKTLEVAAILRSAAERTIWLSDHYRLEWRLEPDPKKRPARLEESITKKLKQLVRMLPSK